MADAREASAQRTASCGCGAFRVVAIGEPVRVHACCCLNCQKETGSSFSYSAFFRESAISVTGPHTVWGQGMGSGQGGENWFCPTCGTRVVMKLESLPGVMGISVGCFADPTFPPPQGIYWCDGTIPGLHRHPASKRTTRSNCRKSGRNGPDAGGPVRLLILQMQMTLDGFIGGPNGDVDWAFPGFSDEYAAWGAAELWNASAHLMGRVTYHEMAAHWPTSTEPYAAPMNEIPKIVFSRTLQHADWPETRVVASDPGAEVARLKRDTGKPLLVHGGAQIARALIRSGEIDVYRLIVHPVVLGNGRSLFDAIEAPFRLRLTDIKTFGTGVVAKTLVPA